jgi:hypothetical protein
MVMIQTCWEEGVLCDACGQPILFGQEMLYGKHLSCAHDQAEAHQGVSGDLAGAIETARQKLATGGRLALSSRTLRILVRAACAHGIDPVRRPDARGRGPWYGRMHGWSARRVERGLSLPEVLGLWLDYIDSGRVPPLSHNHLRMVMAAASPEGAASGEKERS